MAGAATATYSADSWTSPGSVDASQQWEFAVPVRQDSTDRRPKSRSHDSAHRRSRDLNSTGSRSSSLSKHAPIYGRRDHSQSQHGSEAGNPRDIHGLEATSRGGGNVRDSAGTPQPNGSYKGGDVKDEIGLYLDELDNTKWIHRDKLARIESEELQQAAYLFQRRGGLENGRSGRSRTHDSHSSGLSGSITAPPTTEALEPWPKLHEDQRGSAGSPAPMDDGGTEDVSEEERRNWDLRRPEEIAADEKADSALGMYRNPGLRKSSSRIPIPTSSPVPLLSEYTRAPTNSDEEAVSFGKPRRASEPIAVDSTDSSAAPSAASRPNSRGLVIQTAQNSPAKRGPTAKGPSTNRKTSAPPGTTRKATGPRNRTVSTNSQRPTTRSGESRAPNPINRPEGDPPWLATMYKPDPRLPPDQQILPTHARRMQQEQWEREGKTPTTYDREFAPLVITSDDGPRVVRKEAETDKVEEQPEEQSEKPQEPVPPPAPTEKTEQLLSSPKSAGSGTRPNSGTGYSPMPRLQEMPSASQVGLTPRWNPPVVTAQPPPPKEKKCGCCIVM